MTQPALPLDEPPVGTLAWIERKLATGYAIHDVEPETVAHLRETFGEYLHVIGPVEGLYAVSLHGLYSEERPFDGADLHVAVERLEETE